MKRATLLLAFLLSITLSACGGRLSVVETTPSQDSATPSSEAQASSYTDDCELPVSFSNEDDLIAAISTARQDTSSVTAMTAESDTQARANKVIQEAELDKENCFYRPGPAPEGLVFDEINVTKNYVTYGYVNSTGTWAGTFTWFVDMTPEVAMNGLVGLGFTEVVHDGQPYMYARWVDAGPSKTTGCEVRWVADNQPFMVSFLGKYTDDELFAFCQLAAVQIP